MRQHWESRAIEYCRNRSWSDVDQRAFQLISQHRQGRVLEVGIGPGLIASRVLAKFPDLRWFGIDVSPAFLRHAEKLANGKVYLSLADGRHLPFKSNIFDAALEMVTIHHFRRLLIPEVIHEMVDLLKEGGEFISVEDWAAAPETDREKLAHILQKKKHTIRSGEEYHPAEDEWLDMFRDAGLKINALEQIRRPLNFQQFSGLTDPESMDQIEELRSLWGNQIPQTIMSIFIGTKE